MILRVRVIPNAGANEVVGRVGKVVRVKVCSKQPDERANKVLIEHLAEFFDVGAQGIHIMRGENARDKTLQIKGRPEDELKQVMETIP